eukprot:TRINITY_DN44670_c0_g1_i1.p1 TRINITY_DN44670_c0_g1~~TRINITY_DN44670_c0_g1_i1.p1  ORF type:complete len:557 (-),score=89.77 TRINITY_DN44670_c0_g1_i1:19-1656(-)
MAAAASREEAPWRAEASFCHAAEHKDRRQGGGARGSGRRNEASPGQELEDAGWHSCDEKPSERCSPRLKKDTELNESQQDDASDRFGDCPLPMTPPGSGFLNRAPEQRSQPSRGRGLRRPMTPSGFVKCWGGEKLMSSPASASSSRQPSPLVRQRSEETIDEVVKTLAESMRDIQTLPAHACETDVDVFRIFHRALTHAATIFREVSPDRVLASLEPKGITLHFVVDLHMRKRMYRRQTAAALAVLLQSDAWLRAVLQDASLRAKMPEDLSASVPRRSLGRALAPPLPRSPRTPPRFAPETPPQSESPTRAAAVEADSRARAERRNRRATRPADEPISKLLIDSAAQMEALGWSAVAGDADEVVVAFNTFGRAVRYLKTTSRSEGEAAAAWLDAFEPKMNTLVFVAEIAERRRHYRALAAQVLRRLCELESWRLAAAALPEVQRCFSEAAQQSPAASSEDLSEQPGAAEAEAASAACPKSYEDLADELDAAIRPIAPWYLRLFFGILGVIGTLRKCRCLVPRALQQQAEPLLDKVLSFSPSKESS